MPQQSRMKWNQIQFWNQTKKLNVFSLLELIQFEFRLISFLDSGMEFIIQPINQSNAVNELMRLNQNQSRLISAISLISFVELAA